MLLAAAAGCVDVRAQVMAEPVGNVLILLADDMGVDNLAMYGVGSDLPPTPRLDRLAAKGVVFRNVWANPLCSATRATLQTGRYSFRTGMGGAIFPPLQDPGLALREVTLPEVLAAGSGGDIACAYFGKWHLTDPAMDRLTGRPVNPFDGGLLHPNLSGYAHFSGNMIGLEGSYFDWPRVTDGRESRESVYHTTAVVDEALTWIRATGEPWMCFVGFSACHGPFQAPPSPLHSDADLVAGSVAPKGEERRYYKAMIEAMDREIGRLLDSLPPEAAARTHVLFLADNGTPREAIAPPLDPAKGKARVYEGGVHVPLIVSGPRVAQPGRSCDALVNTTDVFATVAELLEVDAVETLPAGTVLDSVSLVPYLEDPAQSSRRDWIFTEDFRPIVTLPHCQLDAGLWEPGAPQLEVCGDPLIAGGTAHLSLVGAPPGAEVVLVASSEFQPVPRPGGMFAPSVDPIEWAAGRTDAKGELHRPVPGGPGAEKDVDLYVQAQVADASAPQGVRLSNVVRLRVPKEKEQFHVVAVRDARYKLIRPLRPNSYTAGLYGRERFYDLQEDPLESHDLLARGPLDARQQAAYSALDRALHALLPQRAGAHVP